MKRFFEIRTKLANQRFLSLPVICGMLLLIASGTALAQKPGQLQSYEYHYFFQGREAGKSVVDIRDSVLKPCWLNNNRKAVAFFQYLQTIT